MTVRELMQVLVRLDPTMRVVVDNGSSACVGVDIRSHETALQSDVGGLHYTGDEVDLSTTSVREVLSLRTG